MRVPLSWLAEYVDLELSPEALAERLTLLGMQVNAIERRGTEWRNVVVGELLAVERHPRADRLSLTRVTIGSGEPLEIVCGATNIAAGDRVPVALPGAVLPGDRRIERTEKMGVTSNGMLCSGDELRLTGDADGILILPGETPLGAALSDLYGDVVLDVDVKPNRGDALSILGLAREVAAVTGATVSWPETAPAAESGTPTAELLAVEVEDRELCPRFVGRWVSGVAVGPSPDRVQMRLLAAGIRPISNVVDASNYVMVELGKPIHTFDAAAVHDGRIVVRLARPGERIVTLDHVERELHPETLLIADPAGPLALAGVMGGADSEVSESTRDVVVESAIFDPVSIRRTAFRYGLRSEASLRFEKGQEHRLARIGADRTARLLAEWAGGTVAPGAVDTDPTEPGAATVAFRPARVNRLLGTALAPDEQQHLLERVGITIAPADGDVAVPIAAGESPLDVTATAAEVLVATVPSWRRDIAIEADLIEEIARVHGYELVPSRLPETPMPPYRASPLEVRDAIRARLSGAGLAEVVTHALVSPQHLERVAWARPYAAAAGEDDAGGDPITVTNPLSADHSILRRSLVASLLDIVSSNARHGRPDVAIFEVGKGYGRAGDGTREWWRLGIALWGPFEPPAWNRPARAADLDDAKGLIELLAASFGLGTPEFATLTDEPNLHPGRSADVTARDADGRLGLSGRVGEIHPAIAESWEIRGAPVIVAELSLRGLTAGTLELPRVVAPPRHPDVERDVAVIVEDARPSGDLGTVIRASAGPLLRDVRLFDVYRGAPLGDEERSLAYRLRFAAEDRTLTEAEVEGAMAAVMAALRAAGGRIRS
ncbi:MAG TPA: phenylalanine--tRNA ligase subunit beta [Candidatus Limnocylindrales bacterium]|nr:phenylalanine--tRNA ligase subunit beta [Candidatus Limnocylindrales bacterium]